jgi:uncharacterized protein YdhG (YjbR/CyaY superfamily)
MEKLLIKTIEDYLCTLPEDVMIALEELRETVRNIAPNTQEQLYYQIPTFKYLGKPLVGFAAFKNHCSFFVMSNTFLNTLKDDLLGLDYSGGTIRFQANKPLPVELIEKIVKAKIAMIETKIKKIK